ncbi:hypothetical protein ES708_02379 [subsurface metagenome]
MPGVLLWGFYPATKKWIPLQVDADGYVKVDMSAIKLNDLGDVNVPAPADGNFFYYDGATVLWKSKAHADLTTGVHGVVSDYIPLAFHRQYRAFPFDVYSIHLGWETIDAWTLLGPGTAYWVSVGSMQLQSGAVLNQYAIYRTDTIGLMYLTRAGEALYTRLQASTALANEDIFFGCFTNLYSVPIAATDRHVGWRITNGEIYASNADGAVEKATDTGVSIAGMWASAKLLILVTAANTVEYYVNGVLKATHTTNMPVGGNYLLLGSIKTNAAVDRRFKIYPINYIGY